MEDRQTPGLYLELGNGSVEDYARRAATLAGSPGVARATWWENCLPGRTDLPMRVPEGTMLAVAEVDESFRRPDNQTGITAHHFVRHSRPSQGTMSGRPTTGLLIVWISPRTPELAASLRDWGDFVHIRHIAAAGIPGFTQISVYENVAATDPRYMHFYEFDSPDAEAIFSTMIDHVAPRLGGARSEAFEEWANWRKPGGRLFYCNTFRLLGEEPRATR